MKIILTQKKNANEKLFQTKYRVRGPWNFKNIIDTLFFRWLEYQESNHSGRSIKDQAKNENINIGILSALISTVWFSFLMQQSDDESSQFWQAYVILWTIASVTMISATVSSIFFLLAIQETNSEEQAEYYINLFSSVTMGLGPHTPLLLFYTGSVSGVLGI